VPAVVVCAPVRMRTLIAGGKAAVVYGGPVRRRL
jgi:hypothetical protein